MIEHVDNIHNVMKPKILFLITAPNAFNIYRGCFAYLRERGFEVHLCSSPGKFLRDTAETEGAGYVEIPMDRNWSPMKDLRAVNRLRRHFREIRPDIVVAATSKAAVLGMIAAKLASVPVRILVKWGVITEGRKPVVREVHWMADKIAALCATSLASCSDSVTNELVRTKIARRNNIHSMRHHVYTQGEASAGYLRTFAPSTRPLCDAVYLRKRFGIAPGTPVIGNIGRLSGYKGIPDLIEAYKIVLKSIPETRLVVIGPHDAIDVVPDAIAWLKEQPGVILLGPQWNLAPYYSLIDLFVCPSHREGNPIVVAEAAAMGLPMVGFRATGVLDSAVDGVTGALVPFWDSAAMAEAIKDYLRHPEKRFEHGVNARRRVVSEWLPDIVLEDHYRIYVELLESKGISRPQPDEPVAASLPVDLDADAGRIRRWLTAKEHLLGGKSIELICRIFGPDANEVNDLVAEIENLPPPDLDALVAGQAVGHFDQLEV